MQLLDYLVIALYAVGMLAIGHYYKRQVQTGDDYLLGGRNMSPFMVGVSLFAALTSTLSYLALPGEMIQHGPMILAQLAAAPLIVVIVGWVLIPRFMAQDVTSGYELLEKRLGVEGRLLGAGLFMTLRILWMASILYATSNTVMVPLLGLDHRWTPFVSIILGLVTIIYSSEGGMRAVVMTDAIQSLIMFAGAIIVIAVVTMSLGSVERWWPKEWAEEWDKPVFWFTSSDRVTVMNAMLNWLVWYVCTAGSDQMAIQRYLSTRDVHAARRSFGINMITEVLQAVLLALVGLAVLGYFLARPEALPSDTTVYRQGDQLFPRFVVDVLPAGLSGLLIAAMLSAAMSSLSSGMNAASAVITTDFLGRFRSAPLSEEANIRIARWSSIAIGTLAVVLSMFVGAVADNLLTLCQRVVNLLTAPLFVLFFMAMFIPWSRPLGAIAATIASVTTAAGIAFGRWFGLEFLWISPISFVVGVLVGSVVSSLVSDTATGGMTDQDRHSF